MAGRRDIVPAGVLRALWTLGTPLRIQAEAPSEVALPYAAPRARGVAPLLDLYLPKGPGPHPSVVLIHGGAFVLGSRTMKPMRYLATRLVQAGFAVVVPDYRLVFRGGRLEEAREDVRAAITWWQESLHAYRGDPQRVSLVGLSAGATLMWLSLCALKRAPHRLVSIFGLYDFTWLDGGSKGWLGNYLLKGRDLASRQSRSPLSHALAPTPCLLIHGDQDQLTPIEHARAMKRARDGAGLETTLEVVSGARHGFLNDARDPVCEPCVRKIVRFLESDEAP